MNTHQPVKVHFARPVQPPQLSERARELGFKLSDEVEALSQQSGKKVALIDGYKNHRMVEKFGLGSLPAMVELSSGTVTRKASVAAASDAASFLK